MALSGTTLGGLIEANLTEAGANGSNKTIFSIALGTGIVNAIIGKSFTTTDAGLITGPGAGSGIGIVSLSSPNMVSIALSTMSSRGANASIALQAIMSAVVSHLESSAELSSIHAPIFQGVGEVDVGSITVAIEEMSSSIQTELRSVGANGPNITNFALAIATGVVTDILAAGTGTVTIVGSGFPGVPGAGVGEGTIS